MDEDLVRQHLLEMIEKVEAQSTQNAVHGHRYTITNGDLFDSELEKGADDTASCLDVKVGGGRSFSYTTTGELRGDRVSPGPCFIVQVSTSSYPLLLEGMIKGRMYEKITIKRNTSIEETNVDTQVMEFRECRIISCEQHGDYVGFAFIYTGFTNTAIVYEQKTGKKLGQTGTDYNAETLTSKPIS